jgi:CheY-like chemotaxis protein
MMPPPTASNPLAPRNCILVVEDDPAIGELLVLALAQETAYCPVLLVSVTTRA